MTTTQRTDIHRPSATEFDPEAYTYYGSFDTNPEMPWGAGEVRARMEAVRALVDQGYRFGSGGSGTCGHCGARIRYAALLARADVREMIFVGEQCLDNRFDLSAAEFQALRKKGALNRERARKADRIAAAVEASPVLAWLTYPDALTSTFLADVSRSFLHYGELTARQIEAVEKSMAKDLERAAAREAREQEARKAREAGVTVPSGRVVVEGVVGTIREQEGYYGTTWKMLVVSDAGWKVWGTVPSSINPFAGDRVRFTATVTASEDDALFGFYARPTKAEVL